MSAVEQESRMRFLFSRPIKSWHPFLALALAVLAVYGQTFAFTFVWDDSHLIAHVRETARREGTAGLLSADYGYLFEQVGYWRPLTTFSLWIDHLITPASWVFHATNVLLYLVCVLLLYRLARSLLPPGPGAFIASLLFALLPPHTESVAFVGNRHDVLSLIFILAGLLAWAQDREGRHPLSLGAGALFLVLAALSKESALVMPAIPVLLDLMDQPRFDLFSAPWWRRNRRWLFAFSAGTGMVFLMRLLLFPGGFGTSGGVVVRSLGDPLLLISRIAFYLSMLAAPWPVGTSYSTREAMLSPATAAGSAIFLFLVVTAAGRRHDRWGLRMAAWAGICLLPVSGIVPIAGEVVAARHLFAASAGPCLLAGHWFGRWAGYDGEGGKTRSRRRPFLAYGAACLLSAALLAASFAQTRVWRSDIALFSRMTVDAPLSRIPFINLGDALLKAGRPGEALAASRRAVELEPDNHKGHVNLAVALERLGRPDEAESALLRAVALAPAGDPGALVLLGGFYGRRGRTEEQIGTLHRALETAPGDVAISKALGEALGKGRRYGEAAAVLESALRREPGDAEARRLLVLALLGAGLTDRARDEFSRLRRIDPGAAASVAPFVPGPAPP
jgi:Flp pilus assembly protein TadD